MFNSPITRTIFNTTPKVSPMLSERSGRAVTNQFIINVKRGNRSYTYFQSYQTMIAMIVNGKITLDTGALGYSVTTSRYLGKFLGMTPKEIRMGMADGSIKMRDLNK